MLPCIRLCEVWRDRVVEASVAFIHTQLTIPRSASAVIVILDLVASTGVISDMSAFFTAENGAPLDPFASQDSNGNCTTSSTSPQATESSNGQNSDPGAPTGDIQSSGPPSSSSSFSSNEPNLASLVFHCSSPSRLVLVWWPLRDAGPSSLLKQIIEEAKSDEGVSMRLPADDQYCVVIG